ncbi:hypothetical protein BX666DRAFT_1888456 [Dichotomocladium elegans]|nr:hypothetical protein BX666DRAFT_1888456 [Dichotomocladium elegans]
MQAWLHTHLNSYIKLNILDNIPTPGEPSWGNGTALLCLAHRFCPGAVPDLPGILQDEGIKKAEVAIQIFQDEFKISTTKDQLSDRDGCMVYLSAIRTASEEIEPTTQTLRLIQTTLVSETQSILITRRTRENTADDEEFEQLAMKVLGKIHHLRNELNEMTLLTTSTPSHAISKGMLDGDKNEEDKENDLPSRVEKFESELAELREKDNMELQTYIQSLPHSARITLSARIQTIHAALASLDSQLDDDFQTIRMAVLFAQLVTPIRNELEYIQAKMLKTATTEDGICDLEERTRHTERMIIEMEIEHADMVGKDKMYRVHFDALKQKHTLVSSWVNEVRAWFVEAEHNRSWIEEQIARINASSICDPLLAIDLSDYSLDIAAQLTSAHENMKKQVEELNKEDLTRLRAHVMALTGVQKDVDKDLSPADTTTIEIIFTTLASLDRLSHLMRRRSYDLQMLTLRLLWEQECTKAEEWVTQSGMETTDLLEKARWSFEEEKTMDQRESITLKNLVIHMLLDLEQRVSEFDQGLFTTVINAYQEMDKASKVELAAHLEARQVELEENFEMLTKRIGYVRQVVEQRITVMDFIYRADELLAIGERLKEQMTIAEQQAVAGDSDQEFVERVRQFQEQAVQLVTTIAIRIRYPELHSPKEDAEENIKTNGMVRKLISQRKSAVILSGDMLDRKLLTYQNALEFLSKAERLNKELRKLEESVGDEIGAIKEIAEDVLASKCYFTQDDLSQLWKEHSDRNMLSNSARNSDLKRLQDDIDAMSRDGERHNAVRVQFDRLNDIAGRIRNLLDELDPKLAVQHAELGALQLRLDWEKYLDETMRLTLDVTKNAWSFIEKTQWQPNTKISADQEYFNTKLDTLRHETVKIKDSKRLELLSEYYSAMIDGFSNSLGVSTIPEHFSRRQENVEGAYRNLEDCINFAQAVLDQRIAMTKYLDRTSIIHDSGTRLLDQIERATWTVMTDDLQLFSGDIEQLSNNIKDAWNNNGKSIPYPNRPFGISSFGASSNDITTNDDVKRAISSEQNKLQQLYDRIVHSNKAYVEAIKFKGMVQTCTTEAETLCEIVSDTAKAIISDQQNLAADVINPLSSPSPSELKERNSKHQDKVASLKLNLDDLQSHCEELIASIEEADFRSCIPTAGVSTALAKLSGRGKELFCIAQRHSLELDVYELRILWETKIGDAISKMYELQDKMRILDEKRDVLHRASRIDEQDLIAWKNNVVETQRLFSQSLGGVKFDIEDSYEQMRASYKSIELCTPFSVDDRQHGAIALFTKLQGSFNRMDNEVDLLSERSQCERAADDFLSSCVTLEKRIETFIQDTARWKSENQERVDSSHALEELKAKVASYGWDAADVIDCIGELVENRDLAFSEALSRRKHDVKSAVSRLENLLKYAKEVDLQKQNVLSIIETAVRLEGLAETLMNTIQDGSDVTENLIQLAEEVEAFSKKASGVPYPVRDTSLSDARSQSLDSTANEVIQETVHARQSRVEKLPILLADAVKSRQLQDERNSAIQAYMTEACNLYDWIQGRAKAVKDTLSVSASCSVQELQSAVGKLDAVISSVMAYENTFNSLTIQSIKLGDNKDVQQRQVELQNAWNQLKGSIGQDTKMEMVARLHRAEFKEAAGQLTEQHQKLQISFDTSKLSDLTDETIASWRQEIEILKTRLHESIGPNVDDECDRDTYNHLVGEHLKLVTSLQDLAEKLRDYRLLENFKDRARVLAAFFAETTMQLEKLRSDFGIVTGASEDESRCRLFSDECGAICRSVQDRMETYHDLKSFMRGLELENKEIHEISKEHDHLEQTYRSLERSLETTRSISALATQWKELHSTLVFVDHDINKVDGTLKGGDNDKADIQLAAADARLATVIAMADKLGEEESQGANRTHFQQHYDQVYETMMTMKDALKIAKEETKKQADTLAFIEAANRIATSADKESSHIKDRISEIDCACLEAGKKASLLEQLYQRRVSEAAASAFVCLDDLRQQLSELEEAPMDEVALESARKSITALKNAVDAERKLNSFMRQSVGHARSADSISGWIDDCRNGIRNASTNMSLSNDKNLEDDVDQIRLKLAQANDFVQSFRDLTQKLLNDESISDETIKDSAIVISNAVIQSRADQIETEWYSLQNAFSELQTMMTRVSKRVDIAQQMKKILSICDDAQERVGRLENDTKMLGPSPFNGNSLSGMLREQDVLTVEQELDAIEAKVMEQIAQEISKMDEMIREYDDTDGVFALQATEIDTAVSSLSSIINNKRKELARALDVGRCLVITDDIDVLVSALEDAAKKATEVDDKNVSKTELRARSIELDARYKYYERKIVQSLDAAQLTADDISNEDDQEMVLRHVRELREHWEIVDREVQAQKAELNKALITAPDRARKSSLPTRKASQFLRDRDRSPSRLPVKSSIHSNSSSPLLSATSRLVPSTSIPRIQPTGSVSATNNRLTPPTFRHIPSKSVSNSKLPKPQPPPPNSYVADPHNDLDIQIGRIVNETPYKVKVKMVPGEVGRYWFGDMNPKLAYCRVLKSKMVMVRVGGGWMELSQFLRSHTLFEGDFIPRTSELQAPDSRIQEGFIETRKQRVRRERSISAQGPAPTFASRSTPQNPNVQAGFMEGDRYIAVDKFGNQLEVRMTKAEGKVESARRKDRS